MRKIQISMHVEMFDAEEPKKFVVYTDANNPYEAACAAFRELLQAFEEEGHALPSFGVSEHHSEPLDVQELIREVKSRL